MRQSLGRFLRRWSRPLVRHGRTRKVWGGEPKRGYKVYTRTGDQGETSLYNGARVAKSSTYFDALGNTDELNSLIGVARHHCRELETLNELVVRLEEVQSRLLDVGSHLATPATSTKQEQRLRLVQFSDAHVKELEGWIDDMDETLPELKNFILPSGGAASSALHVARTVARRSERSVVPLVKQGDVDGSVLRYLNRLSDFFFVAARYASAQCGEAEVVYKMDRAAKLKSSEE